MAYTKRVRKQNNSKKGRNDNIFGPMPTATEILSGFKWTFGIKKRVNISTSDENVQYILYDEDILKTKKEYIGKPPRVKPVWLSDIRIPIRLKLIKVYNACVEIMYDLKKKQTFFAYRNPNDSYGYSQKTIYFYKNKLNELKPKMLISGQNILDMYNQLSKDEVNLSNFENGHEYNYYPFRRIKQQLYQPFDDYLKLVYEYPDTLDNYLLDFFVDDTVYTFKQSKSSSNTY